MMVPASTGEGAGSYRIVAVGLLILTGVALLLPGEALESLARAVAAFWPFSGSGIVANVGWLDKIVHAVLFAACGFAVVRAWSGGASRLVRFYLLLFAYGVFTEIGQLFVPGRSPSAADLVADAIGAACGIALGWYWNSRG